MVEFVFMFVFIALSVNTQYLWAKKIQQQERWTRRRMIMAVIAGVPLFVRHPKGKNRLVFFPKAPAVLKRKHASDRSKSTRLSRRSRLVFLA